jgi:hypothetical protein
MTYWIKRSLSTVLSLAVVVIVLSTLHRQSTPYLQEHGADSKGHKFLYDPRLGWRNVPGWEAETYGAKLSINSKGLRDAEHPFEKPPGVKRILLLGDSFAWGRGAADEDIFPAVLEAKLKVSAGVWEVINAAVSDWGTDQEYLYFIEEGLEYDPEVVILAFSIFDDTVNNVYSRQYNRNKPLFLNMNLDLANVPVPRPREGKETLVSEADPIDLTVELIAKIADASRRDGRRFVLVKLGAFLQSLNPPIAMLDRRFEQVRSSRLGAPYLNLDRAFKELGFSKEILTAGNRESFFNKFGHQMTADILYSFLLEEGIVEARK